VDLRLQPNQISCPILAFVMSLTVIVQFYNESKTLKQLVNQLENISLTTISHCIFVNDGSTDDSLRILSTALAASNLSYEIINKVNGGKSSAIKAGSVFVNTSHVVVLDSDLELATSDIERLWQIVCSDESEFVFGFRRFFAHSSFTWRYSRGNQLISNFYGILFNEVITDIMCGYKLVPADFLRNLPFRYKKFGLEIEIPMEMWLQRKRPYEIEVSYSARSRSQGKSISVRDGISVVFSILKFRVTRRRKS
jgi:glycosyltransferase involved in cell wall biosynthesis